MAAPKTLKNLSGVQPTSARLGYDPPSEPMDLASLASAIAQAQNTINELISKFNSHTHSGVTVGAGSTGGTSAAITGAGAAATNLFTAS